MGGKKIRRQGLQNPVPVYEVMTYLNERSQSGRVVINPPNSMAPLRLHKTGEAWYVCYVCGRSTLNQNKYLNHIKVHSNNEGEELVLLSRVPGRLSNGVSKTKENSISRFDVDEKETIDSDDEPLINFLIKKHGQIRPLQTCKVCRMTFRNANSLRAHLEAIHLDRTTAFCKECDCLYHKDYLSTHRKRAHNPANAFQCPHCPGRMSSLKGLSQHIVSIHPTYNSQPRNTTKRKKKRNPKSVLTTTSVKKANSILTASSPKPKLNFSQILEKKKRKRSSRGNNLVFTCKKCQKTFTTFPSLRHHFYIHTGEKPYPCPFCSMKFRLNSTLASHKKKAHTHGTFICSYCPCKYMTSSTLSRHVKYVHLHEEGFAYE